MSDKQRAHELVERLEPEQIPYVSVEPFHLFRYLDEQAFRFNNRKMTDGEQFSAAVFGIVGKRVRFDELTGKTEAQA